MSETRINRWLLALIYILAFILLKEWLVPVIELTDTGRLSLFLSFILLAFTLSFFDAKWWLTVPVKIFYIIGLVHFIYLETMLPTVGTLGVLFGNLASNFGVIANAEWGSLTNPFRTTLFFVLLWMTTYLIRHWIETKKSILLFYMLTVLFVSFIDTFSAYSAASSIIRIMAIGLLLLGLLSIARLVDKKKITISFRESVPIFMPLFVMLVVSGLFIIVFPVQEPKWPDPVHFIKSVVDGTVADVSKSGYGADDTKLGGPFIEDDTLVFEADVAKKQYWKVETKNTYTTKGWEQPLKEGNTAIYLPGTNMGEFDWNENVEIEQTDLAQITMIEQFGFIVYPYGMTKVNTSDEVTFQHLLDSGQYRTMNEEEAFPLDFYEVEYLAHEFSLKALRGTTMESLKSFGEEYPEYLQLPETLPKRVAELAKDITATSHNVYDKTKAIERYFGRSGFRYSREEVAIPKEADDYVDQFLFDTKMGYCDNFSSSMVVMLRTVGIPARWVKGFAPGESVPNTGDSNIFQITNNEAHSWVEAYMPGIGWMPFEPTIGFNSPVKIGYDIELEADDPEIKEKPMEDQAEQIQKKEPVKTEPNVGLSNFFDSFGLFIRSNLWWLSTGVISIGVTIFGVYKVRRKWLPLLFVYLHQSSLMDWDEYSVMYKRLLKQLDQSGLKREKGETLSNYAYRVDMYFEGEKMRELTDAYEMGIYGGDKTSHDWQRLQGVWKDLIKRTSD